MNKKSFFSVFIVLATYCAIRFFKHSPSLPSIQRIVASFKQILLSESFYTNALYTVKIVAIGIGISFVIGFVIAVSCSMNRVLNALIMPIVNTTKNIPSIALFPLFIILMGIGDAPRIFVIVWNSIYPIIASTMYGLDSIDRDIIDAALNCGATKKDLYVHVKIPLALVNILEGLKISAGNGFIAIVVAEMLGATKGLGYMILWNANTFKYPEMYCYILVVALIGLILNVAIEKIISITERKMYYEETHKYSVNSNCYVDGSGTDGICR